MLLPEEFAINFAEPFYESVQNSVEGLKTTNSIHSLIGHSASTRCGIVLYFAFFLSHFVHGFRLRGSSGFGLIFVVFGFYLIW